jgi:hypothetical protein
MFATSIVPLWSQGERATVTGTVTDQSGSAIAQAKVRAVHTATSVERRTTTTSEGAYTIPALPVGEYRVEIEASGFRTLVRTGVPLTAGSTVRIDATLELGQVAETVTVAAAAPLLQTDTAKVMSAVTNKFVEDLPLVVAGQMRSPLDLALITPEARNVGSDITLGGGQEAGYGVALEGIDATPNQAAIIYRQIATLNSPSIDAITEFSVETNGYKAESGRAGGGMMSYVAKSGTNQLHGSAFYFFRNDALDANTFFNNATNQRKPVLKQSDFGATIGGPVYIPKVYNGVNKTFFFGAFELFRNRTTSPVRFLTIPLPEMYQGDFSNWKDPAGNMIPIYDPRTTRSDGAGGFIRDAFPGNRIPTGRFSTVAANTAKLGAGVAPTAGDPSGRLSPNPRNNFLSVSPGNPLSSFGGASNPLDKYSIKIDHSFNANNRIGFLYNRGIALEVAPVEGAFPALPAPINDFTSGDTRTRVYRFNWDRTISSRIFNQLRAGVNNQTQSRASISLHQNWVDVIGLKNVPIPDRMFPGFSFDDYTGWGRAFDGNNKNKTFAILDDLSWVTGRHSLKFGFHFQEDHYNGGGCHTCSGSLSFSRLSTSLPLDQSGRTGNGFASFLLGEVANANITTLRYVSNQWRYWAWYVQDDWRITPRLTLNYGLRWEYTPPTVEGYFPDGYSNFDPNVPNPGAAGRLGASVFAGSGTGRSGRSSLYNSWPWGFSPRFGLAYRATDKTVLRLAASRSFAPVKNTGGSAHWHGFVGSYTYASNNQLITPAFQLDNGFPNWIPPPFIDPTVLNEQDIPFWQSYDAGRLPESYNLSFNIQRELGANMVAEIGYNGVLGRHLTANQIGSQLRQSIVLAVRPSEFDCHVAAFDKAGLAKALAERTHALPGGVRWCSVEEPDHRQRRLLSARRKRPRNCRAGDKRDELTPF